MYPPVAIGQLRVSYSHDITLGGQLSIPAGTVLWVPHHSIQNVSFNWDEPQKFLPGKSRVSCGILQLCVSYFMGNQKFVLPVHVEGVLWRSLS